tara:strand:- start:56 stop:580 length:525 start_codon:yes stop_codon:yes gene_type:complete
MENWKNFQIEASQDALILEELKKLERIDEVSMRDIAKKVGVDTAKVAAVAALLSAAAPGATAAGDPFAAFDEMDAEITQQADVSAAEKLPADADDAKASLLDIGQELDNITPGTDMRSKSAADLEHSDILNKYGLMNQETDGTSGHTTLVFKTTSGVPVVLKMLTTELPAALQK